MFLVAENSLPIQFPTVLFTQFLSNHARVGTKRRRSFEFSLDGELIECSPDNRFDKES